MPFRTIWMAVIAALFHIREDRFPEIGILLNSFLSHCFRVCWKNRNIYCSWKIYENEILNNLGPLNSNRPPAILLSPCHHLASDTEVQTANRPQSSLYLLE